ncbi:MAG: type II secretion system protein [Pseudomonadota bacterium]
MKLPAPTLKQTGFSLAELAIVLVIVGLLLTGILMPFATQVQTKRIGETQKTLDDIREALLGYAASHVAVDGKPYLPCPDTNLDGTEETRTAGACPSQEGWIPWATLGVGQADAWGNHFRYRVHLLVSSSQTGFTLTSSLASSPSINVLASASCLPSGTVASNVAAIILSHGKNGYGARNSSGILNTAATSTDELENTNGRNAADTSDTVLGGGVTSYDFITCPARPVEATAGEFDDVMSWLPSSLLFGKMIAAGRLP